MKIQTRHTYNQKLLSALIGMKVEKLIIQLTKTLDNWDKKTSVLATQLERETYPKQLNIKNNVENFAIF